MRHPLDTVRRMLIHMDEMEPCLWHAADGRCACCKAKRIRLDVLKIPDYEVCVKERDYATCDFYKKKPTIPKK